MRRSVKQNDFGTGRGSLSRGERRRTGLRAMPTIAPMGRDAAETSPYKKALI